MKMKDNELPDELKNVDSLLFKVASDANEGVKLQRFIRDLGSPKLAEIAAAVEADRREKKGGIPVR